MMKLFETDAAPYPYFAQMREKSPVVFNEENKIWEVYSYNECQQVLGDAATFSSAIFSAIGRPELQTLMMLDPPRHGKMRRLIAKAFTLKLVNQQATQIQLLADDLIDRVIAKGSMDIVQDMAFPVPATVIAVMLGIPKSDQESFKNWAAACLKVIEGAFSRKDPDPEQMVMVTEMTDYLCRFAVERRQNPCDDLLSALATAIVDDESLTIEEIGNTCKLMVNAGHDTTKLLIGNMMHILLQWPELQAQILENEEVFDSAIEEVLRFASPSQFFARIATCDTEIGGQQIKAGQWVKVFLGAANRDPLAFPNPDVFDIHRNPNRHLGFGYGIHFCLGAPLGRLETKICVRAMLKRLPQLRLDESKPRPRIDAAVQFGMQSLPVLFTPAK